MSQSSLIWVYCNTGYWRTHSKVSLVWRKPEVWWDEKFGVKIDDGSRKKSNT